MQTDIHSYEVQAELQSRVRRALADWQGEFSFLQAMKGAADRDPAYIFSNRQIEAIDKCLAMEANKQVHEDLPSDAIRLSDAIPMGTRYFAVDGDAAVTFLRVDSPEDGNWKGWRFLRVLAGPAEFKLGAQRPGSAYRGKSPELVEALNEDPILAMKRYGREIGRCGYCHLRLTDETSREIGIGPICRKGLGI